MNKYPVIARGAGALLLLTSLAAGPAWAQGPTILSVAPVANARTAPRNGAVTVTFSQPLTASSVSALKVFSSQRGGLRGGGLASVSGTSLVFSPSAYDFRPGETVQLSVTRAAASAGGALALPRVQQFTTAVGGTGQGNFGAATATGLPLGANAHAVALGDVDGDGDLDAVTANNLLNSVSVLLNNGVGLFALSAASPTVATSVMPYALVLGDVDGDGDLDLVTANLELTGGTASVRLNDGSGVFTAPATGADIVVGGRPRSLTLGDVDGDGDLDLLVGNTSGSAGVSLRLNNGTGGFTAPATGAEILSVGSVMSLALGDLDGDGDLDLVTAAANAVSTVNFRFNDGTGVFAARATAPTINLAAEARYLAVGDLDADNDLDVAVAQMSFPGSVDLLLNNASGVFTAGGSLVVGRGISNLVLADVNADGTLDLLTPGNNAGTASVRLNNGSGGFAAPATNADPAFGVTLTALALGDVDNDGDLDLVATNGAALYVSLNAATVLATTLPTPAVALACFPNPATGWVQLTLPSAVRSAELLDALGRVVRVVPATAGAAELSLAGLAPGLYVVRAGGQVARLVVE